MRPTLPVKNLIRINWVLTAAFSSVVLLFMLFLLEETEMHKVLYGFMTAVALCLISFSNTFIMAKLSKRFPINAHAFKRYRLLFTYTASAIIYFMLSPLFDYISPKDYKTSYTGYMAIFFTASIVVNSVVIAVHDFVILQSTKTQADLEFSRLKTVHAEAVNLLLKQQIHPHFLFNSLTTLKALYRKDLEMADTYIVHLANFLRASVQNHSSQVSTVEEELCLLKDYLEMQRIRFGNALHCDITIPENRQQSFYLPSFSLQPLLENAIKHNELTSIAPLQVQIFCDGERIVIQNSLKRRFIKLPSASYGLANLAERVRLLSGDEIIIKEEEHSFSVSIKLLSHDYRNH